MSFIRLILLGFFVVTTIQSHAQQGRMDEWVVFQYSQSIERLLQNIHPQGTLPGTVIASPSTTDPDYFYHWVRDAALVMDGALEAAFYTQDPRLQEVIFQHIHNFILLTVTHQSQESPGGIGEPKYNVDATPYLGPWGRPQNDGPALRSLMMMRYARALIYNGHTDYVRENLFNVGSSAQTVIRRDLDYTAQVWGEVCFDLWEEVQGQHFYTLMAQRSALRDGAEMAAYLGDPALAQWYSDQATGIEGRIAWHLDQRHGIIRQTVDRTAGADYKHSGLDTATVLAVLHSDRGDGFFSPSNSWVLGTIYQLERQFQDIYQINDEYPSLGTAFGRYPEDRYYGGNPWFLTTAAIAEHHYKLYIELQQTGLIKLDAVNLAFYRDIAPTLASTLQVGQVIRRGETQFTQILTGLFQAADNYLARIALHASPDGSLDEQFSRWNGYMLSARELTWSYTSFITVTHARMNALAIEAY